MKPFQFEDELSVGNERIDSQHRDLIHRFGRLSAYRPSDFTSNLAVRTVMSDLLIAITRHFIDEEDLMIRHGYPDYEAHAREHASFVEELSQTLHMDEDEILRRYLPSLAEQMIQHLTTKDLAYRPYLDAKG